jgi:hypothetical protein
MLAGNAIQRNCEDRSGRSLSVIGIPRSTTESIGMVRRTILEPETNDSVDDQIVSRETYRD